MFTRRWFWAALAATVAAPIMVKVATKMGEYVYVPTSPGQRHIYRVKDCGFEFTNNTFENNSSDGITISETVDFTRITNCKFVEM